MVDFEITKTQKILEIKNDTSNKLYFLFHGKIYNGNKTKIRRFKYIEWFNLLDIQEYYEKEKITKNEIKAYIENLTENIGSSYIGDIKDYNDHKGLAEFYNYCTETLETFKKTYQ